MDSWTLAELVDEVAARLAQLPAPRNGQIRAVPDERTIRYYASLGLLDRPAAMRGRTALYGVRHVAQVVALKRLQSAGRTLAEIQALWPTVDDATLTRMSGVAIPASAPRGERRAFWKAAPHDTNPRGEPAPAVRRELRIELAPDVHVTIAVADGISLSPAEVAALRGAAAPLLTQLDQLARRKGA